MESPRFSSASEATEGTVLRSLADVERALAEPALAAFRVLARGRGTLTLGCEEGRILVAEPEAWLESGSLADLVSRARGERAPLLLFGHEADFERVGEHLGAVGEDDLVLATFPVGPARLRRELRLCANLAANRASAEEGGVEVRRYSYELQEINAIARALSSERDTDRLLGLILEKCRYVTGADAGSIYVVEDPGQGAPSDGISESPDGDGRRLRFKITQNESRSIDLKEFSVPVDTRTIVGQAVLRRQSINIPDLYALVDPEKNLWGYRHDRSIDEKTGYQTRSMLSVPMIDAEGQIIGVVQLINKKRRPKDRLMAAADFESKVVPFDHRAEELAVILASQAGISLENATLYAEIRQLFEGFVHASVTAIESRDPTTSGHSQRVARLTVALAEKVDALAEGPLATVHISRDALRQIEYAGLLHDFGKVGVRENVLVKAKKLYEGDRRAVLGRFAFLRERLVTAAQRQKIELLSTSDASRHRLAEIDERLAREIAALDADLAFILKANEPTVLEEGGFEHLHDIAARHYQDGDGVPQPYLTQGEVEALSIPRGSLTDAERHEIESHVVHTYNFLRKIPWGRSLREIPLIAGAHHEKLDGSGYPRGLRAEQIPLPAKMMTIADIFDALTASDRPYKKAVPVDKALDILAIEVRQGKLDADLFQVFIGSGVYRIVLL